MVNRSALFILLSLILLIFTSCNNINKMTPDVRNVKWGMNKEEVIKSETTDAQIVTAQDYFTGKNGTQNVDIREDNLVYRTKLNDEEVLLYYTFSTDRLIRVEYAFDDTHFTRAFDNKNIQTLGNALLSELKQKYGDPKMDHNIYTWNTDTTNIGAIINIDFGYLNLIYEDKEYFKKLTEDKSKPLEEKL